MLHKEKTTETCLMGVKRTFRQFLVRGTVLAAACPAVVASDPPVCNVNWIGYSDELEVKRIETDEQALTSSNDNSNREVACSALAAAE